MATPARRRSEPLPVAKPAGGGTIDLNDILGGNFGESAGAEVAVLKPKTASTARIRAEAEVLSEKVENIEAMSPEERIAVRKRILEASVEELRASLPEDRKSLGALISNLNSSFQDIGEEFAKVQEFSGREQEVVTRAMQLRDAAHGRVRKAHLDLSAAGGKWSVFGIRERAIESANAEIAAADLALKEAEQRVVDAQKSAEDMRSERLQTADFEQSFATVTACVEKTKRILLERINALAEQGEETSGKKVTAYEQKEKAAQNMERLQVQVSTLLTEYQQACEERDQYEVGSSKRAESETKVSELQQKYEEAKGQHDQQLVVFQSLERSTKTLEVGEASLRAGLHAHKVTLAQLVADSDVWVVEFRTRVAQIKALASQQATSDLIDTGSVLRLSNAQRSAEFAIGSLETITRHAERHPDQMKDLGVVITAMAEGLTKHAERWKKIEEKTRASDDQPTEESSQ